MLHKAHASCLLWREAVARAYQALGEKAMQEENKQLGLTACEATADNDDIDDTLGNIADL